MAFPGSGLFGDQAVRRVNFFVERDPIYGRRLVMMQTPLLEEASDHPQGYPLVLARGVTAFSSNIGTFDFQIGRPTSAHESTTLSGSNNPGVFSSLLDRLFPPEVVTRIVKIASTSVSPSMQAPPAAGMTDSACTLLSPNRRRRRSRRDGSSLSCAADEKSP